MQNGYILPLNTKILEQYSQTNSAYCHKPLQSSKDMLFESDLKNVSQDSKSINFEDKNKIYKIGTFGRIEEIKRKQNDIEKFYNRKIKKDWKTCKPENSSQQQPLTYIQPKTNRQSLLKPKQPQTKPPMTDKDSQMPEKLEPESKLQLEPKQIGYKTSFYKKDVLLSSETDAWYRALKYSRRRFKTNSETALTTPYDDNGCLRETGQDICDCFNPQCQGCWWLCPSCQKSRKCGLSCRCNRYVIPDELLNKTMYKSRNYEDFNKEHTERNDTTYFFSNS